MKVLIVHNRYQQRGGEDAVVLSERNLLSRHGMEVELLEENNDAITGLASKLAASADVFYSRRGVDRVRGALDRFQPDLVHVHNWFPTLSPAIFWTCCNRGVPVVQTLHNYRLLCVNSALFRDGHICEDCVGAPLRSSGIVHACYRGSRTGSAIATAGMLAHWKAGTWHRAVERFIALSTFARNKLIEGGLPAEKLVVKPNFLDEDPGFQPVPEDDFLFVGRLTEEKGISVLLDCWRRHPDLPMLRILGTGPLEAEVRAAAASLPHVTWMGSRNPSEVLHRMGRARALLCPSLWYEGMPRVVIESLAVGTPVIASRLGTYLEMIEDGKFGALFDPYDPHALPERLKQLLETGVLDKMRLAARQEFEARYTGPANFRMFEEIYADVISTFRNLHGRARRQPTGAHAAETKQPG